MANKLKTAIEANDPTAARKALKTVKDLARKLPKADPPLVYACKLGADAVVQVLLEAGAPMSSTGYEGNHPFAIAAEQGHTRVLEVLSGRAIPEKVVSHALFSAILNGRMAVVRTILERCRPVISQRELEVSTWWKDGSIFKLLLEHGAHVDTLNDGKTNYEQLGETALHGAAGAGHVEPIRLLLGH